MRGSGRIEGCGRARAVPPRSLRRTAWRFITATGGPLTQKVATPISPRYPSPTFRLTHDPKSAVPCASRPCTILNRKSCSWLDVCRGQVLGRALRRWVCVMAQLAVGRCLAAKIFRRSFLTSLGTLPTIKPVERRTCNRAGRRLTAVDSPGDSQPTAHSRPCNTRRRASDGAHPETARLTHHISDCLFLFCRSMDSDAAGDESMHGTTRRQSPEP